MHPAKKLKMTTEEVKGLIAEGEGEREVRVAEIGVGLKWLSDQSEFMGQLAESLRQKSAGQG
jgi:hypothetical protein